MERCRRSLHFRRKHLRHSREVGRTHNGTELDERYEIRYSIQDRSLREDISVI
jgi:hypothetical protein